MMIAACPRAAYALSVRLPQASGHRQQPPCALWQQPERRVVYVQATGRTGHVRSMLGRLQVGRAATRRRRTESLR